MKTLTKAILIAALALPVVAQAGTIHTTTNALIDVVCKNHPQHDTCIKALKTAVEFSSVTSVQLYSLGISRDKILDTDISVAIKAGRK